MWMEYHMWSIQECLSDRLTPFLRAQWMLFSDIFPLTTLMFISKLIKNLCDTEFL